MTSHLDKSTLLVLAQINNEKSRAFGEVSLPQTILSDMHQSNQIGQVIGEKYSNQSITSMAYMNIGGALYVAKNYATSIDFLEQHFNAVNLTNKLEFLRTLMLNYSYVRNWDQFAHTQKRISNLIEKNSLEKLSLMASVQDSIARSLVTFGKYQQAFDILDNSTHLKTTHFFQSQLMRTRITALLHMRTSGINVDKSEFNHYYTLIKHKSYTGFTRHQQIVDHAAQKFARLTS